MFKNRLERSSLQFLLIAKDSVMMEFLKKGRTITIHYCSMWKIVETKCGKLSVAVLLLQDNDPPYYGWKLSSFLRLWNKAAVDGMVSNSKKSAGKVLASVFWGWGFRSQSWWNSKKKEGRTITWSYYSTWKTDEKVFGHWNNFWYKIGSACTPLIQQIWLRSTIMSLPGWKQSFTGFQFSFNEDLVYRARFRSIAGWMKKYFTLNFFCY